MEQMGLAGTKLQYLAVKCVVNHSNRSNSKQSVQVTKALLNLFRLKSVSLALPLAFVAKCQIYDYFFMPLKVKLHQWPKL